MRPFWALALTLCLLSPLGALSVRIDASGAPQAERAVALAVRHAAKGLEGENLLVTLSSFSQDDSVTSLEVTLLAGGNSIVERPLVATSGWEGRLRKLLESQLSYDLLLLYPPASDAVVLEELYLARPAEGFSFKPGLVCQSRSAEKRTGLLVARDVYGEVVRLDALSDHGIRLGQELVPASGQGVEGWFSIFPLGGELSWSLSWPYPFQLSLAVAGFDRHLLFEAGLEKLWPLSSVSHTWFLRNSSIGAAVRMGIASPFALGASASVTWRTMVTTSVSFAVSGRLLYYGNQEEKRAWQDGYQLLCGVGYHW